MAGKSNSANPGNTAQANHFMSGKRQETEEKKSLSKTGRDPIQKVFRRAFRLCGWFHLLLSLFCRFLFPVEGPVLENFATICGPSGEPEQRSRFGQLLLETRQMLPTGLWLQLIYIGKLGKNFDEGLCEIVNCYCLFQVKREFLNFMRLNHSIFSYFCVKI